MEYDESFVQTIEKFMDTWVKAIKENKAAGFTCVNELAGEMVVIVAPRNALPKKQ